MEWNIMEKEGSMPEFTAGPGGTILPNPLVIRFSCRDFQDSDRDYCKWEIAAPGHNFRRRADFLCEGIQFHSGMVSCAGSAGSSGFPSDAGGF